jgi:hypothetical protein
MHHAGAKPCYHARMKLRNLRIAWSVAWGVVAVLLCVLWVRSYWRADYVNGRASMDRFFVTSEAGFLCLDHLARDEILRWTDVFEIETWEFGDYKTINMRRRLSRWTPHHFRAETGVYILRTGPTTGARWILYIPIWYFVVLSVVVGFASWIRWSKNFSLRTLLIATTLVGLILGFVLWLSR